MKCCYVERSFNCSIHVTSSNSGPVMAVNSIEVLMIHFCCLITHQKFCMIGFIFCALREDIFGKGILGNIFECDIYLVLF